MRKILDKNGKNLYVLDFDDIKESSLQLLLESHGYKISRIKSFAQLIETIVNEKQDDDKPAKSRSNKLQFIEENIKNEDIKDFFAHLQYTIRWITEILDQFHIGFSIFNQERHLLFNGAFMDFLYTDYENYKNLQVGDTLVIDDRQQFKKEIQRLLKNKNDHLRTSIHSIVKKHQSVISLIFNGFPVKIENENFVCGYFFKSDSKVNKYSEVIIYELHQMVIHSINMHANEKRSENLPFKLNSEQNIEKLTNREQEVLQLIYKGLTNQQISEVLNIGVRTVETHRANLLSKTNAHNTADLVRYAIEHNLL